VARAPQRGRGGNRLNGARRGCEGAASDSRAGEMLCLMGEKQRRGHVEGDDMWVPWGALVGLTMRGEKGHGLRLLGWAVALLGHSSAGARIGC
jgi:hypothetical protein